MQNSNQTLHHFLLIYETRWIRHLRKSGRFADVIRFINNLISIDDGGFEICCKDILRSELEPQTENIGCSERSFPDLETKFEQNKFNIQLYDKR